MSSRIHKIEIKDVLNIESVVIEPKNSIIELNGETGQGKTNILRAIKGCLGGKKEIPKMFIREGTNYGSVKIWIGEAVPEMLAELSQYIEPETGEPSKLEFSLTDIQEGKKVRSPQKYLDAIGVKPGIDFLAFLKKNPKEQIEDLKRTIKIDIDLEALEKELKELEDERVLIGREHKTLKGAAETKKIEVLKLGDVPDEEVSVSELMTQIQAINSQNMERDKVQSDGERIKKEVNDLESKLRDAKNRLEDCRRFYKNLPEPQDTTVIQEQIEKSEEINKAVRIKKEYIVKTEEARAKDREYYKITDGIEALRKKKMDAFARAKMPVEGMTFDEEGIKIKGFPLDQSSGIEQLHTAVMIALGDPNPARLNLLIADEADQIGGESFPIIQAILTELGAQLWISTRHTVTLEPIVIKNGKN